MDPRLTCRIPPAAIAGGIAAFYLLLVVAFEALAFPVRKDEVHFWPTSLQFSRFSIPPSGLLRSYGELNTPLPFILFGAVERLFHGGIQAARTVNLLLSAGILLLVAFAARTRSPAARAAAVLGVLSCPYFAFVSIHTYTEVLAILCVVSGITLHSTGRYLTAALAFSLGIASRQYMVAFPAAVMAYEVLRLPALMRQPLRWISPLAAIATLGGWFIFFGGFGPAGQIAAQKIQTAGGAVVLPQNSLYFLACLAVYYVLPEAILFRRSPLLLPRVSRSDVAAAVVLLLLFLFFPPLHNVNFPIPTMGFLDVGLRRVTGDVGRIGVFYLLALLTVRRFMRPDLACLLVAINTVLMMKAHIAWDKYALPLLVVLWYIQAGGGPSGRSNPRSDAARGPARPNSAWLGRGRGQGEDDALAAGRP